MKKWYLTGIIFGIGILLTACTNQETREKIESGMQLNESYQYTEAVELFDEVLLEGDQKEAFRGKGIAYIGLGEYELAIGAFCDALASDSYRVEELDYDINYYLALAYYKNEQYEEAKEVYDSILNLKSKEEDAVFLRGKCYLHMGNKELATDDFNRYLLFGTNEFERYLAIYESMEQTGYAEDGRIYIQKALDELTNLTSEEEGILEYYLGNYEHAKELMEESNTVKTKQAALVLGKTYEALGADSYAASVYLNYIALDETSAEIYNQLAMCKLNEGSYDEALQYLNAGFPYAEKELLQIMKFNEVVIYEYAGEFDLAKSKMEEYLADYPSDESALREFEFLKSR